jgi:FkbM family methyltransferase
MLHRLPVGASVATYIPLSAEPIVLLHPRADQVAKDIWWGKGQPTSKADAQVLRLIERLAPEADLFLDIGAYSALFALLAARCNPKLRSIAYEIMPQNMMMAERNVIENDLIGRVQVRLLGLSDKPQTITMPKDYNSASNPSSVSLGDDFHGGVKVPVTTLDLEGHSGRILAKIDVEGFEEAIFVGGAQTIAANRPDFICEFLSNSTAGKAVTAMLKPLGYRFLISTDDGFDERPEIIPSGEGRDWLLTTRSERF